MTPIRLIARSGGDERVLVHEAGPLEIGRGRPRDLPRFILSDPTVSRDHLRMELQLNGQLLVENLSASSDVLHNQGPGLRFGDRRSFTLPCTFAIGQTDLVVELAPGAVASPPEPVIGYTETLKDAATTYAMGDFIPPPPEPAPQYQPPAAFEPPPPPAFEPPLPAPEPAHAQGSPAGAGGFFSPGLAERIAQDPALLEAREREVTVLCSVAMGVQAIAARMEPGDTFSLLQDISDIHVTFVHETGGVVLSDGPEGFVAAWNAPAAVSDHAWVATLAAQRISGEVARLGADIVANAGSPLRMGMGLVLGRALAGPAGGRWRQQYGVAGPVLREARFAALGAADLGIALAITAGVRRGLPAETPSRRLGHARVPEGGVIELWELVSGFPSPEWEQKRDSYQRALSMVEEGRWSEAIEALRAVIAVGAAPDLAAVRLLARVLDAQAGRHLDSLTEIATLR